MTTPTGSLPLVHDDLGPRASRPVVLLHGITGSRCYWSRLAPSLAESRRVVAPDLPGFGQSPKPHVRYDLDMFADALEGLLRALGLQESRLDACGHSLGGLVLLRHAERWPSRWRRLALLNLPIHASRQEAHRHFLAGSGNYRRLVGQDRLGRTLASWVQAGPAMASRYAFAFSPRLAEDSRSWTYHSLTSTLEHSLLPHGGGAALARVAAQPGPGPSLLLLHGDRDQVAPLARVQEAVARSPGLPLEIVSGTGHHPLRTHPRRVARLLGSFFAEPSLTGASSRS